MELILLKFTLRSLGKKLFSKMSIVAYNYCFWEFWAPYDPPNQYFGNQKVTIDGENRLIIINQDVTSLRVKEDIYSAWKDWVQVRKNAEFYAAFRTTGGDPVGGGLYTGDVYFLINNWKIVVNQQVTVEGIIYDETPGVSPFIVNPGGGVINIVSNLAYQYSITGGAPSVDEIWEYLLATNSLPGSAGDKLKQALTTGTFIALNN